jgi:hypothetical protein
MYSIKRLAHNAYLHLVDKGGLVAAHQLNGLYFSGVGLSKLHCGMWYV